MSTESSLRSCWRELLVASVSMASLAIVAAAPALAANEFVIDDFEDGAFFVTCTVSCTAGIGGIEAVGGARDVDAAFLSSPIGSAELVLTAGDDAVVKIGSTNMRIVYDGVADGFSAGTAGILMEDLTVYGDRFRVDLEDPGSGTGTYLIEVWDGATGTAVSFPVDAPGTYEIAFSSFPVFIDFTDIRAISLRLPGNTAVASFTIAGPPSVDAPLRLVAIEGEPAPAAVGGTYEEIVSAGINDVGEVGFVAEIDGGSVVDAVVLAGVDGTDEVRATFGSPTGGPAGTTFTSFTTTDQVDVNAVGELVHFGNYTGSTSGSGSFVSSASGGSRAVAITGQSAPGTGGTFPGGAGSSRIAPDGSVGFFNTATGGGSSQGFFLASPAGVLSSVAFLGQAAPASVGGTFSNFPTPRVVSLNASGQLAFRSILSGGSAANGIFAWDPAAGLRTVLVPGGVAPGTGGGLFSSPLHPVSLDDDGNVALRSSISGGTSFNGIFVIDPAGAVEPIVVSGVNYPGVGTLFDFNPPELNEVGDVAFSSTSSGGGVFVFDVAGHGRTLAGGGDDAPGVAGGVFRTNTPFGSTVRISDAREVAFQAFVDVGGSTKRALYTAALDTPRAGGFEVPSIANDSLVYNIFAAGGPWTFERNAGLIDAPGGFAPPKPPDGVQVAFLQTHPSNPANFGSFSQLITLSSSGYYRLEWFDAGRGSGAGSVAYQVLMDGAVVCTGATTSAQPWTPRECDFPATVGEHELSFRVDPGQPLGDDTAFIDGIELGLVTSVPVGPTPTYGLVAAGTLLLGALAVFRRQRPPDSAA